MARNVALGQAINLEVQYKDANGAAINVDATPQIQITDSEGNIALDLTSTNVASVGTGHYRYTYIVPDTRPTGTYNDVWVAYIGGGQVQGNFTFTVLSGGTVSVVEDEDLGDDPTIDDCTQGEIDNINYLLDMLKKRLKSDGTRYVRDQYGAIVYDGYGDPVTQSCDVFSDAELITFLRASLSEFNSTPHFSSYTFADFNFTVCSGDRFSKILVDGAVLLGLAAQMLIEKGREFVITDNGVSFQPPAISDILQSQYNTLLNQYWLQLKYYKENMKPSPIGLGTVYSLSGGMVNPRVRALRHLRERRIY
jgi:hypothetical protein